MKIAALYVATDGPYFGLPGVEPWDEKRDARTYTGPWPVVAHPPCQLWTNMARVNFKRYGGEHNRPGNDGGCFECALRAVKKYGGVLEHPAFSHAWKANNLHRPGSLHAWPEPPLPPANGGWSRASASEWTCEVWQSAYGHKARKRTWLYYASPAGLEPMDAIWTRVPGTHQIGWFDRVKPTLGKSEASRTPIAFRDYLISLARHSRRP